MTDTTNELQNQLAALLAQVQQQPTPPQTSWNKSQPTHCAAIAGVAIPISVETPRGKIRCYLSLPAECAASPDALLEVLATLDAQGYPLEIWEGRQAGGWGGGADRSNGGNWRGNRRWSR